MQFQNEYCEGSAFLLHRTEGSRRDEHDGFLSRFGLQFELQLHCRFKTEPRGPLWVRAELEGGPLKVDLPTRALCQVLLLFAQKLASSRGITLRYSFGTETTSPHFTVPAFSADRLIFSKEVPSLPIKTDASSGTWFIQNGKLEPVDRSSMRPQAGHSMILILGSPYVDLHEWRLCRIPGAGTLDLTRFWGNEPFHVTIFDEGVNERDEHQFLEAKFASIIGEEEKEEDEEVFLECMAVPDLSTVPKVDSKCKDKPSKLCHFSVPSLQRYLPGVGATRRSLGACFTRPQRGLKSARVH